MRLAYPAAAVLAMLLCGLWHGAGATFLVWGLVHGVLLAAERLTNLPKRLKRLPGGRDLAIFLTALVVCLTWIPFRAGTLGQAGAILGRLFGFAGGFAALRANLGGFALLNIAILLGLAIARETWHHYDLGPRLPLSPALRLRCEVVAVALLIPLTIYLRGPGTRFIYFQF